MAVLGLLCVSQVRAQDAAAEASQQFRDALINAARIEGMRTGSPAAAETRLRDTTSAPPETRTFNESLSLNPTRQDIETRPVSADSVGRISSSRPGLVGLGSLSLRTGAAKRAHDAHEDESQRAPAPSPRPHASQRPSGTKAPKGPRVPFTPPEPAATDDAVAVKTAHAQPPSFEELN